MSGPFFIATAVLYALASVLYLVVLTRGSDAVRSICNTVFGAAVGGHIAFMMVAGSAPSEVPLSDMSEILSLSALGIAAAFLLAVFRFNVTVLGAFIAPISLMLFLASGLGTSYAPVSESVESMML